MRVSFKNIFHSYRIILRLMIGYSLSIGFIGIEMFGFMSGITMFSPTNGFICILFILLLFFVLYQYQFCFGKRLITHAKKSLVNCVTRVHTILAKAS